MVDDKLLSDAIKQFSEYLEEHEIYDKPLIKIKDFAKAGVRGSENREALAVYRSKSQFTSGKPIFWVNSNFDQIIREVEDEVNAGGESHTNLDAEVFKALVDTLLHEYGHVIYESADFTSVDDPELLQLIEVVSDDPEEFAEEFMQYIRGDSDPAFDRIVSEYGTKAFDPSTMPVPQAVEKYSLDAIERALRGAMQ